MIFNLNKKKGERIFEYLRFKLLDDVRWLLFGIDCYWWPQWGTASTL